MADNQKQDAVFLNSHQAIGKSLTKKETSKMRYWRKIGLGFKTPTEAITQNYVDKKCPFTGNVSIRGRILKGLVISTKMERSIIIRRDYLHYVKKYNRFEKRHRNIPVHLSPCFKVKEGDIVIAGQCRFNCLKVIPKNIIGKVRKQFILL